MSWWWTPEQRQEHEDFLQAVRELTEKAKKDPEIGRRLLIKAGIYNEDGKLTKEYGGDA